MEFTYQSYKSLIEMLGQNGYKISDYHSWKENEHSVILRHDVDYDLDKAVEFAAFESEIGVRSTYFVLISSDFYNLFSDWNHQNLTRILSYGHEIGLHFDEIRYNSQDSIRDNISREINLLETVLGKSVKTLSMHRPSQEILEMGLELKDVINSYSKLFFEEFKYLSDSRRRWREPVEMIIESKAYDRLQILTHPFWYYETELDLHDSIERFVNNGNKKRYQWMSDNFTDIESVMRCEEVI